MSRLLTGALLALGLMAFASAQSRTTFLVPIDVEPTWRDMAFLAAIPASEFVNKGGGSLIAIDSKGGISPEIRDYAKRYRAESLVALAPSSIGQAIRAAWTDKAVKFAAVSEDSAEATALELSSRFWRKSTVAVVTDDGDYESALVGATLASLIKAPLLFHNRKGISPPALVELRRLGVKQILAVGSQPPKFKGSVTALPDAKAVMAWVLRKGIKVSYLAAVNPKDRTNFVTRKLSMAGAQLAAGRGGLAAPLNMATEWKRPFESRPWDRALPMGVRQGKAKTEAGTIAVDGEKASFFLTGESGDDGLRLSVDRGGKGVYAETYASGDTLEIGRRKWVVSLGNRTRFGKTKVHLTWPTADEMKGRLEAFYKVLGSPPEHLCLVGFPDSIPHAIFGQGGIVEEQTSDLPFAMVGQSEFARIGTARLIAENLSFGTLYAARALTYRELIQPDWSRASGQAEWENSLGPLFQNAGFTAPYHLSGQDIPWETPPADGKEGKRAASFGQDSPMASCAILAHSEHSWWQSLGSTIRWDATVLLAPSVVESGGCATATLDREPDNRSIVARLLRLGAIGFSGGSRELPAQAQPLRMAYWNGILAGQTLGQAHRLALNAGILIVKDEGEGPQGPYRYCTQVRMQFGDPALALRLPSAPRVSPARTVVQGDKVTVHAPGEWWIVKTIVPPDWKQWAGRDLYAVRGAGAIALSSWTAKGRDQETMLVLAEFTSRRKVKEIKPENTPDAPLGWLGKWHTEPNTDGTFTYRFAVRMIDFDQERGQILRKVDRLDFKLIFE